MWPDGDPTRDTFGRKIERRRRRKRTYNVSRFVSFAMKRFGRCQWCNCPLAKFGNRDKTGHALATADHLIAVVKGGTDDFSNLCLSCEPCNNARGSSDPVPRPFGPQDWGAIQSQERRQHDPAAAGDSR